MNLSVRPRSDCTKTSPVSGGRPFGRNTLRLDGQRWYEDRLSLMNCDMSGCIGKPSDAKRVAAAATSPKLIVPKFESAVIHASGAAGTTQRSTPGGILPPCFFVK